MANGFFRPAYEAVHRFWTRSIRRQLILGIALVHAALMTGFVLDLVNRQQAFLQQQSIGQATTLAETLAVTSVSWVLADDMVGLDEVVGSLKNAPSLEYAMVLDDQDRVLAHTVRQHVGKYLRDTVSLALLGGGKATRTLVMDRNLIDIAAPILANGKCIGWARVCLDQSEHRASLMLVARNGAFYVALAILFGTVLALFISKGLTGGLADLVRLSAQIQAGARKVRADGQRVDEIGALGRGFNGMLAAIEDSEKSLMDSLDWKKSILDNSAVGILVVSGDSVIREANPRLCSMFGYEPEELLGKSAEALHMSQEGFQAFGNNAYRLISQQGIVDLEYPLKTRDGLPVWCMISGRAIDPSALDKGMIWVLVDITKRKLAEEALTEARNASDAYARKLEKSEEMLRVIIEAAPTAIIGLDLDGNVHSVWNQAAERMLGWSAREVMGRPLPTVPKENEEEFRSFRERIRKGLNLNGIDVRREKRDGSPIDYSIYASPLHDLNGNIIGNIAVLVDITERKRADEELARINAALEAKNTELEQVVYVASHDLRSPLVNIDGYSKELGHAVGELGRALADLPVAKERLRGISRLMEDDIFESLRFIQTSTTKMEMLLAGLLRLSRSGRAALTIETLGMNMLISRVIDSAEFKIREAGITLEVADLPPCRGDAVQVDQVFSNLLDNAVKYLDPSRPGIIRIHGRVEQDRSVYCVEDNGIGIAPANLDRIFQLFLRLNPQRCEGEGMGLTIVKRILDRLEGRIWVESEVGLGSRFYVALPTGGPR